MTRAVWLVCALCMACGTEPGPGPAPAADGGGDAAQDAGADAPRGVTAECGFSRLDCDGNRTCETVRDDANCRGCGLPCAAGEVCVGGSCLR